MSRWEKKFVREMLEGVGSLPDDFPEHLLSKDYLTQKQIDKVKEIWKGCVF